MTTVIYATAVTGTEGVEAGGFLLRPQRTPRRSPSKSNPFAHASAARSADTRSLKLIKAHLKRKEDYQLELQQEDDATYLDFPTWTIERKDVGSTPGNDLMTRVRMVSSVADAGKEEMNSDIWSK